LQVALYHYYYHAAILGFGLVDLLTD